MAFTNIQKLNPSDPIAVIGLPCNTALAAKIQVGLAVSLESSLLNIVDAATDDATFVGLSMGATAKAGDPGPISVARVCTAEATLGSATYAMGAALKWSADYTYVADAGANTLAWVIDNNSTTRTVGIIYVNIFQLSAIAGKLIVIPAT